MKDEMIPVTGSVWEQMLKDHYEGRPIPIYRPYIPLQWVDVEDWGRDIGKQNSQRAYLEYEITKKINESNDNG